MLWRCVIFGRASPLSMSVEFDVRHSGYLSSLEKENLQKISFWWTHFQTSHQNFHTEILSPQLSIEILPLSDQNFWNTFLVVPNGILRSLGWEIWFFKIENEFWSWSNSNIWPHFKSCKKVCPLENILADLAFGS